MKRIINGTTYNTDTSTLIARSEYEETNRDDIVIARYAYSLYQTRGAAFFLDTATTTNRKDPRTEEWEEVERHEFQALTQAEAARWVLEGDNVELFHDVFGEPPEAAEETTPGSTVYLRIPTSLKDQMEAASADQKLSVNSWAMRCIERCANLGRVGEGLGEMISTGLQLNSEPDPGAYSEETVREMVAHMSDIAEEVAQLLGWRGNDLDELSTSACSKYGHRNWPVYDDAGGTDHGRSGKTAT
jgi:hypothetical protein